MTKFRYRLEQVLDFRESEKKDRERELAETNRLLRAHEEHREAIMAAQEHLNQEENEIKTMAEIQHEGRYQEALQNALIHQRLMIIEAAKAVEAARDAYIEKSVEVETLEELKARKRDEWKEERRKEEKRDLDELVVQRHRLTKPGK